MKIALIAQLNHSHQPHRQERFWKFAHALTSIGHSVIAYAPQGMNAPSQLDQNLAVVFVRTGSFPVIDSLRYVLAVNLHVLFRRCDVVHFTHPAQAAFAWIAGMWRPRMIIALLVERSRKKQRPACWWVRAVRFLVRDLAITCTHVVMTDSEHGAQHLTKAHGCQVSVIPTATQYDLAYDKSTLATFGLKPTHYLLTLATLAKHSGLHRVIETFKQLEDTAKTPNNFKLAIVADDAADDEYVNYVRVLAEGRSTIALIWEHPETVMHDLISGAYLLVDQSESLPEETLQRAMGRGIAPFVQHTHANRAYIGDCGFFYSPETPDEFRDQLAFLLNRKDVVLAKGQQARTRMLERYSWQSVARIIEAHYFEAQSKQYNRTHIHETHA